MSNDVHLNLAILTLHAASINNDTLVVVFPVSRLAPLISAFHMTI
jgi:hypothetical protein